MKKLIPIIAVAAIVLYSQADNYLTTRCGGSSVNGRYYVMVQHPPVGYPLCVEMGDSLRIVNGKLEAATVATAGIKEEILLKDIAAEMPSYTLPHDPLAPPEIHRNGLKLMRGLDYTFSGRLVGFADPARPQVGDSMEIAYPRLP